MQKYWVLCAGCRCVSVPAEQARCYPCRRTRRPTQPGGHGHHSRAKSYGVEYERIDCRKVYERDSWRCGICRRPIDPTLKRPHPMSVSLDHIVPMALGGAHIYVNVQAAHLICNSTKSHTGSGDQLALFG